MIAFPCRASRRRGTARKVASLIVTALVTTTVTMPTSSALGSSNPLQPVIAPETPGCVSHYAIAIPGGTTTFDSNHPERQPIGAFASEVAERLARTNPGKIKARHVGYRTWPGAGFTYEQGVSDGVRSTNAMLRRLASQCPDATFSLTGYSMGADVGSHVLNEIGNGHGVIPAEKLAAASLIANPRRGMEGVVEYGNAHHSKGVLGPVEGGLGSVAHRVLEPCKAGDSACDSDPRLVGFGRAVTKTALATGTQPVADMGAQVASQGPGKIAEFIGMVLGSLPGWRTHQTYETINVVGGSAKFIEKNVEAMERQDDASSAGS